MKAVLHQDVSILVLLEVPLRPPCAVHAELTAAVSILVLLEVPLRQCRMGEAGRWPMDVSILVLLEVPLRQ